MIENVINTVKFLFDNSIFQIIFALGLLFNLFSVISDVRIGEEQEEKKTQKQIEEEFWNDVLNDEEVE